MDASVSTFSMTGKIAMTQQTMQLSSGFNIANLAAQLMHQHKRIEGLHSFYNT